MLSQRAKSLKPSPTLALASKAKELKAEGKDVISLSVGEPDWDTFDSIKNVGLEALQSGQTKYAPSNGTPAIRDAIVEQIKSDIGMSYDQKQVTVSTGAKFIIFSALQTIIDPGDEVIIPAPYWVSYPTMAELAGGVPRVVVCDGSAGFKLTGEMLKEHINPKTKAIILNSPSNPTGVMYSKEDWQSIGKVLEENPHVVILMDDIYNRLVFNDRGLAPHLLEECPSLQDRTIVINGASKTYSMTGWRVGWAIGPDNVIAAMNKYQSQSVSCASPFSLEATTQAIRGAEPELKDALKKLKTRRDFVYEALSSIDGIEVNPPDGAFYIWPDISSFLGRTFNGTKLETTREFCAALLEDQTVVCVPGIDFGLDGYVRISYALEQDRMQQAVDRLKAFLAKID